jgi:hypothetical protein
MFVVKKIDYFLVHRRETFSEVKWSISIYRAEGKNALWPTEFWKNVPSLNSAPL